MLEEKQMLRILATIVFGYWAYRVGRELVDSVPEDFDIVERPGSVSERARPRRHLSAAHRH